MGLSELYRGSHTEYDNDTAFVVAPTLLMGALITVAFISQFIFRGSPAVAIAGIAIATAGYFALILWKGMLVEGAFGAMLVTSTFGADIPLASRGYIQTMPRAIGPQLFLFELFLCALIFAIIAQQRDLTVPVSKPTWLFFGLIVWCFLATAVVRPARMDTALFFNFWLVIGFLVFVVSSITVWSTRLRLETIFKILGVAVGGHTLVAFLQFANQQPFGMTVMGENALRTTATVPVATYQVQLGVYLQGFTGFGYNLAGLHVLLLPVVIALAAATGQIHRKIVLYATAVIQILFVFMTWNHAGIGAAVVAVFTLVVLQDISRTPQKLQNFKRTVTLAFIGIGTVFALTLQKPIVGAVLTPVINTLDIRLTQYVTAIIIAIQQPLFGVGPANFYYLAVEYGLPRPIVVDNVYLELLATTGIIGMVLFISFVVSITRQVGFCGVQTNHTYLLPVGAGLVGFMGLAFWEVLPLFQPTLFIPWMTLLGVIAHDASEVVAPK